MKSGAQITIAIAPFRFLGKAVNFRLQWGVMHNRRIVGLPGENERKASRMAGETVAIGPIVNGESDLFLRVNVVAASARL